MIMGPNFFLEEQWALFYLILLNLLELFEHLPQKKFFNFASSSCNLHRQLFLLG